MNVQSDLKTTQDFQVQLDKIFSEDSHLSIDEIGRKLVENGILDGSERKIFLKHLQKKWSAIKNHERFYHEHQLLLACGKTRLDSQSLCQIEDLINPGLNWNYIAEMAIAHQVAPLLYHNLCKADQKGIVPQSALDKLRKLYQTNGDRNSLIYDELNKVIKASKEAGIEVIVLKGAVLAMTIYPNTAVRPMNDVDLLVREADFPWLRNKLYELGYITDQKITGLAPGEVLQYAHYLEQIRFFKHDGSCIETHFRLQNAGIPDNEDHIWQRSIPINLGEADALSPGLEDFLLHLCLHVNQHNFCKLRLFCDIAGFITRYQNELDWEGFCKSVQKVKAETSVYHALYFTNTLLGISAPLDIMGKLEPNWFSKTAFNFFWNKEKILQLNNTPKAQQLEAPLFYLLQLDSLKNKLSYLIKIVFPPVKLLSCYYSLPPSKKLYLLHLSLIWKVFKSQA